MERAVLVGCGSRSQEEEIRSSLSELERLADTARAIVVDTLVQYREVPEPAWLIGRGKVEELAEKVSSDAIDVVIFDRELSPGQQANLDRRLPCKVLDRTRLILDIFAMRAKTKEGSIQVELAQLEYMLPRLAGRGHELSRLGGGIGTRGPGEKKLETDRRHIRRRIRDLKQELERVQKHRRLHQSRRRKMEMVQVALVGYTNAGKSTLLNRLTGADVREEDRLFATLDPTSRFLELPSGEKVMLTDTVGFIRNLPHHLVEAFQSTLEQVREADLLLHVVDASHPEAGKQMIAVDRVLKELQADRVPTLTVFNKADRPGGEILTAEGRSIRISAWDNHDLDRLKDEMDDMLYAAQIHGLAEIPVSRGEMISHFYQKAEVVHSEVDGLTLKMDFRLPLRRFERMSPEVKSFIRRVY
ncbi:GTP-binding protein HflX [Melghirimyces thermohalophilus]|uniref:GTPase HflX n=1 Tax=Melghirimyces thermohalophilus TaxID=1236220 RepID=A0A1G6J660_9BACL|nr:GTPase HflX [Melghirimyces thermohalophilus]SDC14083.1 GTP-binding protein HflX [Melghirimyces thermohalophilus]